MTIPDISPTIFDIIATVSVLQYPLYCCHHNSYGSYTTWPKEDIIHTLYDITVTLFDIIPQYLWHHSHCIHDTRSPVYDIISRVCDISSPIPVTIQTICLWIHINNIYHQTHGAETIQPLYLKSQHPCVYLCDHTHSIHDITYTVLMIWHLLYLWHIIHCIWHLTMIYDITTVSVTSVYYISYQTDYIWQHIHCISVITPRLSVI